jgi:hypothetical protein
MGGFWRVSGSPTVTGVPIPSLETAPVILGVGLLLVAVLGALALSIRRS